MAAYLVTWDLNKEKPNYSAARAAFVAQLDKFNDSIHDSGLDSVRFVATSWTASQISNFLREAMDDNDRLFVTRISKDDRQGWLSKTVGEWLNAHD